jgi:hypothetical protein
MSTDINGINTTVNPTSTGWVNQANGVVLSRHRVKRSAVATGRQMAKRHGAQHTVHRKDGSVIQTRTYSTSPV